MRDETVTSQFDEPPAEEFILWKREWYAPAAPQSAPEPAAPEPAEPPLEGSAPEALRPAAPEAPALEVPVAEPALEAAPLDPAGPDAVVARAGSPAADAPGSSSIAELVEEQLRRLVADLQRVAAAQREVAVRQARLAAEARAAEMLATEVARVRSEAQATIRTELQRARSALRQASAEGLKKQLEEAAAARVAAALEDERQRHHAALQRTREEAEADAQRRLDEAVGRATEGYRNELARVRAEAERAVEERVAAAIAQSTSQLDDIERVRRDAEATIAARTEEALSAAARAHAEELARVRAESEAESARRVAQALEEAAAAHEEQLSRVRQSVEAEVRQRVARAVDQAPRVDPTELARLQARTEAAVEARVTEALAAAGQMHAQELARVRHEVELAVTERFERQLAAAAEAHSRELARAQTEAEDLISEHVAEAVARVREEQAAELERLRLDLEAARQAARPETESIELARQEERQAVVAEIDRLRRSLSRLDDSRALPELLEALVDALNREVPRLAVLLINGDTAELWRTHGFGDVDSLSQPLRTDDGSLLGRTVETGHPFFVHPVPDDEAARGNLPFARLPEHARGLIVPLESRERVVAAIYADDCAADGRVVAPTWPELVEVLVRHAGRCLAGVAGGSVAEPTRPPEVFMGWFPSEEPERPATDRTLQAWSSTLPVAGATPEAEEPGDRRSSSRVPADAIPWLGGVRLQPGHEVSLVDVSDGGALVESNSRLVPGTSVLMQFLGAEESPRVRGKVLRCAVYALEAGQTVKYRAALEFSEALSRFFERVATSGHALPQIEILDEGDEPRHLSASG